MKASDLFVRCLEAEGVEYIFGIPGEENLHILESIRKSKIRFITTRHEQAAAFMAATYGRLTGEVGVCLATLGPGATNLVTGIAHAHLGGFPLLAITGQKAIRKQSQGGFQVLDVVNMMQSITKRSVQIKDPQSIPKEVRSMFKTSQMERMGSCHIEIPEDVASEEVAEKFQPHQPVPIIRPVAHADAIEQAAELIRQAQHPLILVSSRAQRYEAYKDLLRFCNETNIYVIHTQLGKGVLSDAHKNSLFSFGVHRHDLVNCAVDYADLLITVGYNTVEFPPSIWNKDLDKKIVDINFTHSLQDIYNPPLCEVIGDVGCSLRCILGQLRPQAFEGQYFAGLKERLQKVLLVDGAEDDALKPRRIVADCRKALGPEDVIFLDNGIYKLWFSRHYPTYSVDTFLADNALASMGAGLPGAMATKLMHPDKKVLAVCGDGGFMMNSQELETAVRLKLHLVVLILNDNGFGFIKWKQQGEGYPDFALDYGNPDFVKYAESYGARGIKVESAGGFLPVLQQAFDSKENKGPVVIECPIDYSENAETWGKELDMLVCPAGS